MTGQTRLRQPQVVIVEQRALNASFLQFNCHRAGCEVGVATSAEAFIQLSDLSLPDLIVLDWTGESNLPQELISFVRHDDLLGQVPVLHFGETEGEMRGDYDVRLSADICGNRFTRELQLILQAQEARAAKRLTIGGMQLNPREGSVTVNGMNLNFGATEVSLLSVLLRNPDVVLNRNQLLDKVWGRASDVEARTVDVHISRIRKRLRPFGLHYQIQTARGVGYRFIPDRDE